MVAFDLLTLSADVLVFMDEGTLVEEIKSHPKYVKSVYVHPFVSEDILLVYTLSLVCWLVFMEDISFSDHYCLAINYLIKPL